MTPSRSAPLALAALLALAPLAPAQDLGEPTQVVRRGGAALSLWDLAVEAEELTGAAGDGWRVRLPLGEVLAVRAPGAPVAVPLADRREEAALALEGEGDLRGAVRALAGALEHLLLAARAGALTPAEAGARAEVYLVRLALVGEHVLAPREQAALLERVIDAPGLSPLARDLARTQLAHVLRQLGEREAAAALDAELGVVRSWFLIGPFDNERGTGFAEAYPPEVEPFDPQASYPGKSRPVSWRALPVDLPPGGAVDLDALLRPQDQGLAYAVAYLHVAEPTPVALRLGSDEAVAVWVNREQVHTADVRRPYRAEQDAVGVVLAPGWNEVLLKVADQTGDWGFRLRVSAPEGGPAAGVRFATAAEIAARPAFEQTPPASVEVERGALEVLAAQVKRTPDWRGYYHLGLLQHAREAHDRTQHPDEAALAAAVALAPDRPGLLLLLARARQRDVEFSVNKEENARRRTLEQAIAVAPHHAQARAALAHYYLRELQNVEKARRLLEPALATYPDDLGARLLELDLLRARGLAPLAVAATEALFDAWEARVQREEAACIPAPVLRAALGVARSRGDVRRQVELLDRLVELDRTDAGALHALAGLHEAAGRPELALTLLTRAGEVAPYSTGLRYARAQLLERMGRLEEAGAALDEALALAPDDAALTQARGELAERTGNEALADELFAQALRLDPQRVELKKYVEYRARHQERVASFQAAWVIDPEPLVAAAKSTPLDPRRTHRYLLLQEVARVNPDGTQSQFTQQVFRVENRQGARDLVSFTAPFSTEQRILFQRARVWRRGGGYEDAPVGAGRAPRGEFSGYRGYTVRFPPLEPGDVIEVRWRVDDLQQGFFGDYYGEVAEFQADQAIDRRRFVLIAPKTKQLFFHTPGLDPALHQRREEGEQVVHVFERTGIAPLEREPHMPWDKELVPQVQVSTFGDWDAFARWYWGLVADQHEADDAIRAKVHELCAGATSDEERIRRIYHFVITEVRYNAAWEFGIHGFKPYNATKIFARRFGDCKDKATLIGTMLGVVGIEAHPVLIFGEEARGREDLSLPLMGHFNHCISWVEHGEGGIFLDGTAEYHPYPALPAMDYGAKVVVITPQGGVLREIPYRGSEANSLRERHEVRLAPDGGASFTATIEGTGTYESILRDWMHTAGLRKERLEPRFGASFSGARVTAVETSDVNDLEAPVRVKAEVEVPRMVRQVGGGLELAEVRSWLFDLVYLRGGRLSGYAADVERTHDLVLPVPSGVEEEVIYQLPPELSLESVPEAVKLEGPQWRYERTYQREGSTLRVRRVLRVEAHRIAAEDYPAFRRFVEAVERAEKERVRLGRGKANQ